MLIYHKKVEPVPEIKPEVLDSLASKTLQFLTQSLGAVEGRRLFMAGQKIHELGERTIWYTQVVAETERILGGGKTQDVGMYKYQPVGIEQFINDEYYLGKKREDQSEVYPEVMKAAIELNSGKYVEAVLTGGIGSAKTTLALYTTAYQLYLLSCMRAPHRYFGLDSASEILFIFQSITKDLAKGVDYQRFKSMLEHSPYFKERFPFDKNIHSRLVFPHRVEVAPVSGADTAAIGQNVISGVIDELNYMAVIEKSRASVDKGTYDQAVAVYNSISRRRKSRYLVQGKLPGILCLVSSKKYPGQFTDSKIEEAKGDPTIYVYDKRVWEIKPEGTFISGWFYVFIGDYTRKPYILAPGEAVLDADRDLVLPVPMDFLEDFKKDIINALREIGGISTLARHPYFMEVQKVNICFGKQAVEDRPHYSVFKQQMTDFQDHKLTLVKGAFYKPELPRFGHIDLAISSDSAGVALGTVIDFVDVHSELAKSNLQPLYMPRIWMDGVLEVRPPRNSEIVFSKIRQIILILRDMGLNIRWLTFDQFQSADSIQLLRQQGFTTGQQSIDTVPCRPYDFTKSAMYEERLLLPEHTKLHKEILMLERDLKTGKIDHPPNGSKDCADALAGVVYGLTMRREMWGLYGISLINIPSLIRNSVDTLKSVEPEPEQSYLERRLLTT